jgi:tRNA (adenine-N(1)-)-methyltransferase non-catalytic subunit
MGIMNMDKATVTSVLTSLNWSTIQEDYAPSKRRHADPSSVQLLNLVSVLAPSDPPLEEIKSEKHRIRLSKRKMATDTLMRTRNELFAGEFEA